MSTIMESKRLKIDEIAKRDYSDILELHQNIDVRKFLGGIEDEHILKDKFQGFLLLNKPEQYFVLRKKNTGKFVGLIAITQYKETNDYEISYELNPIFWGRGYAEEAAKNVIKYVFEYSCLTQLIAETQKKNVSSIRLLEKLNFHLTSNLLRFGEEQFVYTKIND